MNPRPSHQTRKAGPPAPQSWNRYAYVLNNPVNFADPLGLYRCAYLNDAGNGLESVDDNSSASECANTGGYGEDTSEFSIFTMTVMTTITVAADASGGPSANVIPTNGSLTWAWNFGKSLIGGFKLPSFGPGSCLSVAASGFTSAANAASGAAGKVKDYAPPMIQAANPVNANAASGALYYVANAAEQMKATPQDVAAYITAAGGVSVVASSFSAAGESALALIKNPYALAGAADAAGLYGVVQEGLAAYRGQCHF